LIHCGILLDFLYELYYDAWIHKHQIFALMIVYINGALYTVMFL